MEHARQSLSFFFLAIPQCDGDGGNPGLALSCGPEPLRCVCCADAVEFEGNCCVGWWVSVGLRWGIPSILKSVMDVVVEAI